MDKVTVLFDFHKLVVSREYDYISLQLVIDDRMGVKFLGNMV